MGTAFITTGSFLLFLGFAKFLLFNPLWGKKPWYSKFNYWYGKLMIAATIAFIIPFVITLIQALISRS